MGPVRAHRQRSAADDSADAAEFEGRVASVDEAGSSPTLKDRKDSVVVLVDVGHGHLHVSPQGEGYRAVASIRLPRAPAEPPGPTPSSPACAGAVAGKPTALPRGSLWQGATDGE